MFKKFLFVIFVVLTFSFGLTAEAFEVPALTGPVVDQVNLLKPSTKQMLSQMLMEAHQNQGPQIQVLIINTLDGEAIDQVAIQVYDKWKLGDEKTSKGALLLIAVGDKKLRIEVGRGLEGDIPDAIAKRIVMDTISPSFKRGEFDLGVVQGVTSILHYAGVGVTEPPQQVDEAPQADSGSSIPWVYIIIFIIWIILFITNPSLALALLFAGRGGRGGGGGGWSGGGGSSAGGGASGGW